ncbi:MAG: tyrosine--tRNA ligase [Acidimicrobiaceae bacterium]|nr:tyrosine--tRNA ligase [Acidimicrobiaceae bacterium]
MPGVGVGLFEELSSRGLIAQVTDDRIAAILDGPSISAYIGFDPTADSLHVGHLVQIFNLRRLQEFGHRPIAVAGGATGLIGDPSGKSEERNLLNSDGLSENLSKIQNQLSRFLDFDSGSSSAMVLNNADWLEKISLVDFLREVGKHFSVNQMVTKDSVRSRLSEREQGISYTEFSYMLLQSYDFLHLFDNHNCQLQMGASDQWGNITSGIELIRRVRQKVAYGLTTPLVLKADGTKFGKSESATVWIDPSKTSPYQFYQFFLRAEDEVVGGYLRLFTWLGNDELADLDLATARTPSKRLAQSALARAVTDLVHGPEITNKVQTASRALFSEEILGLSEDILELAIEDAPTYKVSANSLADGVSLVDLFFDAGLVKSKSESRKVIAQGGAYLNNVRIANSEINVHTRDLIAGGVLLLRRGKKDYVVVRVLN